MIPYGLAVRIPGFHLGGPGSTPGFKCTNFARAFLSFYQALRLEYVESIKVRFLFQRLYYENFLARCHCWSKEVKRSSNRSIFLNHSCGKLPE